MLVLTPLAALVLLAGAEPTREDWSWLDDHRAAAFESIMPFDLPEAFVKYRSYRDLSPEEQESYFAIHGSLYSLEATVVIPDARSVQQQLLDMHMANRAASFGSLLQKVRVRRMKLTAQTCPAIKVALDRLAKLRWPPPALNVIILHPTVHQVSIAFPAGRVDATLNETGHPLAAWATATLTELERCPETR